MAELAKEDKAHGCWNDKTRLPSFNNLKIGALVKNDIEYTKEWRREDIIRFLSLEDVWQLQFLGEENQQLYWGEVKEIYKREAK